jgi:hypothetical protein
MIQGIACMDSALPITRASLSVSAIEACCPNLRGTGAIRIHFATQSEYRQSTFPQDAWAYPFFKIVLSLNSKLMP